MKARAIKNLFYWSGDRLYVHGHPAHPVYVRTPPGFQDQVNSVFFRDLTPREILLAACLKP